MPATPPRRTLVVANRTPSTPVLLQEIERRARERATTFAVLVPPVRGRHPDWSLETALQKLRGAAHGPVEAIAGEGQGDALDRVRDALDGGRFDDVLVCTVTPRAARMLHRDLARAIARLGVPVSVITARGEERLDEDVIAFDAGHAD